MMRERKIFLLYMLFVFASNFNLLSQFLSSFLVDLKFDLFAISSLYLIFQVTKFVFEVPTGYVADRYGRKISALAGTILLLMSYFIYFTESLYLFYLAFFIKGISVTLLSGSIESIYVENVKSDNLIKYNTIERLVFYISLALSALVAGYMIEKTNYISIILTDICILLIVTAIIFLFPRQSSHAEKLVLLDNSPDGKMPRDEGKDTSHKENKQFIHSAADKSGIKDCLKVMSKNKLLVYLLIMDFSNAFSFIAIENLYPAYLEKLGVEVNLIGIFMAFQLIVSALFGLLTPKIRRYISDKFLMYILPSAGVLIMLPIYTLKVPINLIPILFTAQLIAFALYAPIKYILFQKNIPDRHRATFISLSSQAVSFGGILFYLFSTSLGLCFSIDVIITSALLVTFALNLYSCVKLSKIGAVK